MIRWLPWLVLLLLALLSTWASMSLYQPIPSAEKRQTGTDHAFIQPVARVFDKDGQAAYDIRGTQLEHRAESDEHVLTQANMRLYSHAQGVNQAEEQREYWDIQAERARIMADREHVQLEGQVHAERGGVLPVTLSVAVFCPHNTSHCTRKMLLSPTRHKQPVAPTR